MLVLLLYLTAALALRGILAWFERKHPETRKGLERQLADDPFMPQFLTYRTVVHIMCLTPVLNLALLLSIIPLYYQFKHKADESKNRDG